MDSKKKCYVDVTQLVHWEGYLAGIPRVMNEISKRFISDESTEFIYVSWVKEIASFCIIDFFSTMEKRGNGGGVDYQKINHRYQNSPQLIAQKRDRISNKRRTIKGLLRRVVKKIVLFTGLHNTKLYKSTQSALIINESQNYKKVVFKEGDSIFISWGEWWDDNFLRTLEDGVSEVGLNIIPIIHDVLPFTLTPQFSGHSTESLQNFCRRVVSLSSLVLCVSNSTRNDLASWYKSQKIKIPTMKVFRLGEDFDFAEAMEPKDEQFIKSGLKGNDYLICVGTIEAKKNHQLLYYTYKLAKARGIDLPKLVIVGRRGWKTETTIDFMTQDPEVKEKFIFLHNASDENLSWLYDHALLSVFPSFAEGWGIPIAESVSRGVPCACSNTTSMTEIAEEYVLHFTPSSTDECLNALKVVLEPKVLASLRKKCRSYKQTTWDESYRQIRKLMKEELDV